ncbi:LytR/AlgR family response regulator transcription factor [Reichenbachiella agariperforans]|uniref:LytR/AlgR family response regulator transcription factor n=1 Tax=Reichenbachiella agariperforans TaxID=156994 RepID=UPI001C08811E|nr:LytTR family DNA-binding domain-containing protein [Reichenbachiella agariperforans]MBU2915138.1 LytTR family DNA-binding domain-containing protein [Reichenbachiella agariperforans]
MLKKLTCVAIDDEFIALKIITSLIDQTGFLTLLGSYQSAVEGTNAIIELEPDIVFLDVQMPEISGLDIIKSLNKKPEIILITSQVKYAVEAFEFNVTDYLVKPIESYARFMNAVTKAKDNIALKEKNVTGSDAVFMKIDFLLTKVQFESILYVEGYGDYIKVHTADKTHVVYYKLSSIEDKLPKDLFMRVHRSYLVQINKIDNIDQNSLVIGDNVVPVSAKYKPELLNKIEML